MFWQILGFAHSSWIKCVFIHSSFLNFLGFFCVLFSGAVYLEGGLEESRQLFGRLLFNGEVTDSLLLESNLDSVLCHRTRCVCACVSLSFVCTHLVLERSCGHTRQDFPIFGLCKTNCNIFANLVSFIRSNPHTACFGKVPHIARYWGLASLRTWDLTMLALPSQYLWLAGYCVCTDMHKDKTI